MIRLSPVLISSLVLSLCSCTTMTEEQRYERDDRFLQARETFYRHKEVCHNMGGTMELSLGNLGKPTYRDYRSARCRR